MEIKLPDKLEQYVREKMATGKYANMDELVAEALTVLRNVEEIMPSAQDDLRREIDLGLQDIEAGRVSDWDVNETIEYIRQHARGKKAS